jgi:hypothetical protein
MKIMRAAPMILLLANLSFSDTLSTVQTITLIAATLLAGLGWWQGRINSTKSDNIHFLVNSQQEMLQKALVKDAYQQGVTDTKAGEEKDA